MNAWQLRRSLSDEQRKILEDGVADLERPPDELLAVLKPIAAYGQESRKMATPLTWMGCLSVMGAVLSLFAVAAFPLLGVAAVALLGVAIAAFVFASKMRKAVSPNLRAVALPLLATFREDFDSSQPVHAQLDLRMPLVPDKKLREEPPFALGAHHKIVNTFYEDAWMTVDGQLRDGSRLRWSITETIREQRKTKRNARGKYKTKTKLAKKSEIAVQVAMRKDVYELAAPADAAVKSGEKKNTIKVVRRIRSDSLDPIHPEFVVDAIASIYRSARPLTKGA